MRTNQKFTAVQDKIIMHRLADKMFRYKNSYRIPQGDAAGMIYGLLDKGHFSMYTLQYDVIPHHYRDEYIRRHGDPWYHSAGTTRNHNDLGMRWAVMMEDEGHVVSLSDSPDISGKLNLDADGSHSFNGDVGQCSLFPAFAFSSFKVRRGYVWISVFEGLEICLEAETDLYRHF